MEELLKTSWFQDQENEFVNAFLSEESQFLMAPSESFSVPQSIPFDGSSINRLISNLYNGPTLEDIESSLSMASYVDHSQDLCHSRISMLERGNLSKGDNKYTLKIRSYGNVMADDGYKWRKYGQKSIKNSPNPRSYYKCTNPRCNAKKQVERSTNEPDTLHITYEGLHLHYTYPFFQSDPVDSPVKKPKRSKNELQEGEQNLKLNNDQQDLGPNEVMGPQGLLEDIVPLIIRKPKNKNTSSNSSSSSSSSSPLSFSWSPHYSPLCFD